MNELAKPDGPGASQPGSARRTPRQTGCGALVLEDFLPYRLSVLTNRISSALAAIYAERFDLTIPEWRVMAVLGRHPCISARDIASLTAMDKVRVSRALARLRRHGRLSRRADPSDARRSILRLSRRGQRIYEDIVPQAKAFEGALLNELAPGERAMLERVLRKLARHAGLTPPTRPTLPPD